MSSESLIHEDRLTSMPVPAADAAQRAAPLVKVRGAHAQRLRTVYRSAGWPCQDLLEVELLAAGLLERIAQQTGIDTLRVTDAGLQCIVEMTERNRAARSAHEGLVARIAEEQTHNDRLVFTGLFLRAKPANQWLVMRPDVFSIRNTTVEDYVEPVVHEIKVTRADLLGDLRKPEKRGGYMALSSAFYFVITEGIASPAEIPEDCGVIVARTDGGLERARTSPRRPMRLGFDAWMAMAKAVRFPRTDQPFSDWL